MASAIENSLALWMWPMTATKFATDWFETLTSAQTVVDARLPMIAAAWTNPFTADYRELMRMTTEKSAAFGRSQRPVAAAQDKVRRAGEANARALETLSRGRGLGLGEWASLFGRNLEIMATLAVLPVAVLAPIHATATANARRLGRS